MWNPLKSKKQGHRCYAMFDSLMRQWMLENVHTDKQDTWGNIDLILQKIEDNTMHGTRDTLT